MDRIISRKQQIKELEEIYNSGKSEFVVVYGRRRVGKTFLVRELFNDKFVFYHTALSTIELDNVKLTENQLIAFCTTLKNYGAEFERQPQSWFDAFGELRKLIVKQPAQKRVVVFIDEMPWLDTKDSGFITAFENFWNSFGDGCHNLMLIVCGSATTWIADKLINNYGGLYNRITRQICLEAFTLGECEEYYKSLGISMSRYDQALCYMALGGIPYYMSQLKKGMSVAQNLDNLFFKSNAIFRDEFNRLCASQFLENDKYKSVLKFLSSKRLGYTRKEISEGTQIPFGGGLTEILKALEVSGFIMSYTLFEGSKRNVYYKLIDLFTLFWMHFLGGETTTTPNYFQTMQQSQTIKTWQGFAFEELCFVHRSQIAKALGINGITTDFKPWRYIGDSETDGAQVDMLIDRADNMIDLCEMKFYGDEFAVTKEYDANLRHKLQTFIDHSKNKKSVNMVLITTFGLKQNMYFSRFQQTITLDDLF
ncbi:MAG: AAA family ATPase [Bacteroidales bacterium]|nr:AAA family ATPase [Bacteroidales bacterium]